MVRKHGFNYGFWAYADGRSYWGVQSPNTVEVMESVHRLDVVCKARLIAWMFKS